MAERTLTQRDLNRALLARQLLLERASMSIPEALEQVGGLQTQYAPSGYVGLWTRLAGFQRDALTDGLETGRVIQATLLRVTIHLVSRREFWPYAMGVRQARRALVLRTPILAATEPEMVERAERLRVALADGPRTVKELGELGAGFVGNLGLWVDLVRVPPSGTWERRRADRLALAEQWIGPSDTTEEEGLRHLVRAYLRAFGPAAWKDIASWAGISASDASGPARSSTSSPSATRRDGRWSISPASRCPTRTCRRRCASCPIGMPTCSSTRGGRASCPSPSGRGSSARRTRSRSGPTSSMGHVAGAWSIREGRVELDPYRELGARDRRDVERRARGPRGVRRLIG